MRNFLSKLLPFIFMGIALVAFIFGIMLLAYLFFFGALIGLVLFCIAYIRDKFFLKKKTVSKTKSKGRIIDSDDWKKL